MKTVCLALDIDHTIVNTDNMKTVEWYASKDFWLEQIRAVKTQVEARGNKFMLAIVTSKPYFDDICDDLLPALAEFLQFKEPSRATPNNLVASPLPSFQIEGTVYTPKGNTDVQLGTVADDYFSSFHIVPNSFAISAEMKKNKAVSMLMHIQKINKSPYFNQLEPEDKRFMHENNTKMSDIFDGKHSPCEDSIMDICTYLTGLKKVDAMRAIKKTFNVADGDLIFWDDKKCLIDAVESSGINAIHATWKDLFEIAGQEKVVAQAISTAFDITQQFFKQKNLKSDHISDAENTIASTKTFDESTKRVKISHFTAASATASKTSAETTLGKNDSTLNLKI